MNLIRISASFFLPPHVLGDNEQLRVHSLFVAISFLTALFAFFYLLMSIYIDGIYFAEAMAVSIVLFSAYPLLLKIGVPLTTLANLYLATIAVVYCLLVYWEGGLKNANVAPWILIIPPLAALLQGKKNGITWLVLCLLVTSAYSYFDFRDIHFPVRFDITKGSLFSLLSLTGLSIIILSIIIIFENGKIEMLARLEKRNEELAILNREKNEFLKIVSHDLKNPLAAVKTLAEVSASDNISAEKRRQYLNSIALAADKMFSLIRNLLDLNLAESGRTLNPELLNLNTTIFGYVEQYKATAASQNVSISADIPADEIRLLTDKAKLQQVLDNYVSNAIKYRSKKAIVLLRVRQNPAYTEIAVIDNGPGISKSEQQLLFTPFGTTSSEPVNGEQQTGLGLAIIKKIAEELNANVGCISETGAGSTFFIRWSKNSTPLKN